MSKKLVTGWAGGAMKSCAHASGSPSMPMLHSKFQSLTEKKGKRARERETGRRGATEREGCCVMGGQPGREDKWGAECFPPQHAPALHRAMVRRTPPGERGDSTHQGEKKRERR